MLALLFLLLSSTLFLVGGCADNLFFGTRTGHLTLLTVADPSSGKGERLGGTADVYLEVRPGRGRVFMDSLPLTKLDTQGSTRYANRIACNFLDAPCERYDFYYTIRAEAPVVGGPSASGAIAVLTAAVLADAPIDESVVMTGTINSGGIIGPVAGVAEKAFAAKEDGARLLVISNFSSLTKVNKSYLSWLQNESLASNDDEEVFLNASRLYVPVDPKSLGLPVARVSTLGGALFLFTGDESFLEDEASLVVEDESYTNVMRGVATTLCDRRDTLASFLNETGDFNESAYENRSARRAVAVERGDWYSAASYCFTDLISLRGTAFESFSQQERLETFNRLFIDVNRERARLDEHSLENVASLETYVIVAERLREARDALVAMNVSNVDAAKLGFAFERYHSALTWSAFFDLKSPSVVIDEKALSTACLEKLREAEVRVEYANLYVPAEYLTEARDELGVARGDAHEGQYALCLFRAAKAQARADLLSGTLSLPKEHVDSLVAQKVAAAGSVIARQQRRGFFPILGYSYYRYADSLAVHDPYSALTFAEYAIELSNLEMYFPRADKRVFLLSQDVFATGLVFFAGLGLGALLVLLSVGRLVPARQSTKQQKKRQEQDGRVKKKRVKKRVKGKKKR